MSHLRFGCGEFVPGGEPITVPNLPVPTTPVVIPWNPSEPKDIPPFLPPRVPGLPKVKCVDISPGDPSWKPPFPGAGNIAAKECRTCDGTLRPDGTLNPPAGDPGCIYNSIPACQQFCKVSPPKPTLEPAGPANLGPITPGGSVQGYLCQEFRSICIEDVEIPIEQQRIKSIIRTCEPCTYNSNATPNLQVVASGTTGSDGYVLLNGGCVHLNKTVCEQACGPDQTFVENCISSPTGPGSFDPTPGGPSKLTSDEPVITQLDIQSLAQSIEPQVFNTQLPNSQLYNSTLNFFSQATSYQTSPYSNNYKYLNVFNSLVASEVSELLNREGSIQAWREEDLFSLTLDHIRVSINQTLLFAFRSIHYPGGQLVGEDIFLEAIRKHLLTGTCSEIDADFYTDLARRQKNDVRIKYVNTFDPDVSQRAGLGVIAAGSVLADPDMQINIRKRQMRRQRRLNTDVRAQCVVDVLNSDENKSLFLTDAGIDVITLDNTNISVPTGDGDGYYIHVQQIDCADIPLITTNDYSSTYYVPPDVRYNALTLFNEDPNFILTASSLPGSGELVRGSEGPSSLAPVYMSLNLKTLGYTTNSNPLVARYKGDYVLETDTDIIDEHVTNNGMAVTRVNLDYRDPIFKYIIENKKATIEVNDINFKSIKEPKDFEGGVRISRNIPFGIVITPVMGSKHNPFQGFSVLSNYGDTSVRALTLSPGISISDTEQVRPELEEVNLYSDTGNAKVGLVEQNDDQNVKYKYDPESALFSNTFFVNGQYATSSSVAPVSSYGVSYLVKDVIDYIVDTYDPDDIVWFDVLRRMPINKVGELIYNSNKDLISDLERGLRNELLINNIIKSDKDLSGEVLPDDSKVVITKEIR